MRATCCVLDKRSRTLRTVAWLHGIQANHEPIEWPKLTTKRQWKFEFITRRGGRTRPPLHQIWWRTKAEGKALQCRQRGRRHGDETGPASERGETSNLSGGCSPRARLGHRYCGHPPLPLAAPASGSGTLPLAARKWSPRRARPPRRNVALPPHLGLPRAAAAAPLPAPLIPPP